MAFLPPSVPHIDLAKDPRTLEPGTREWNLTSRLIREALETYGCFLVEYDRISVEEREELFAAMESLFALPVETKRNIEKLPRSNPTYPGQNPQAPLHQALGIVDAQDLETARAFTDLMWPDGNRQFCQTINSMSKKMQNLAHTLMKMIFHSFGLEKYYEHHLDTSETLFHMIRYSAPMKDEPTVGVLEHVDASFLTILCQNEVNGLLTKPRNGEWMQVIPGKSTFIVQTGLSFRAWSNGRLHVPPHKVTIRGHKVRLNCGLFFNAMPDQIIETPDEVVDEEHPLHFKPFRFGEFYRFFRARRAAEDSLDVFAGIDHAAGEIQNETC